MVDVSVGLVFVETVRVRVDVGWHVRERDGRGGEREQLKRRLRGRLADSCFLTPAKKPVTRGGSLRCRSSPQVLIRPPHVITGESLDCTTSPVVRGYARLLF